MHAAHYGQAGPTSRPRLLLKRKFAGGFSKKKSEFRKKSDAARYRTFACRDADKPFASALCIDGIGRRTSTDSANAENARVFGPFPR